MDSAMRYLLFILLFILPQLQAAPVPLRLGMSAPLTGPAAWLGEQYKAGAELAFNEYNAAANRHYHIELIVLDDQYEPSQTVTNSRLLLDEFKVQLLFGVVGTPNNIAILPLLKHYKTVLIAPMTGAAELRLTALATIFHVRGSYQQEADFQVNWLANKESKVALLLQADEFGASAERSYLTALQSKDIQPVISRRFQRNSEDILNAMDDIIQAKANLILMAGTYKPLLTAIHYAEKQQYKPTFATLSFAGASAIAAGLHPADAVYATSVIPDPYFPVQSFGRHFASLMEQQHLPVSEVAFEGYIAASLFSQAIEYCIPPLENVCLLTRLSQQDQLGDLPLHQTTLHQGLFPIRSVLIKAGRVLPQSPNSSVTTSQP